MWDVQFYDETTRIAYRMQVKRLTVGDGIAADSLQDQIALREDMQGRELLALSANYPLLRYGTATMECAVCETPPADKAVMPDDLPWRYLELTEEAFWSLDEWLLLLWVDAILTKNPHRDLRYERLKKNLAAATPARPTARATSESPARASTPAKT